MKKLLLIAVLMLAMVITLVACTEDPVDPVDTGDTTVAEGPTEEPTEAPTNAPEDPTDAPEETTAEEPTDAPDDPVVTPEETDPSDDPAETPAETEPETEPETVDPDAPVHVIDPEMLLENATSTGGQTFVNEVASAEIITEAGRTFIKLTPDLAGVGDAYVTAVTIGSNLTLPNYMAISYRNNGTLDGEMFIGSGAGWNGQGDNTRLTWAKDGQWNLMIVDLSACGVTTITDGLINFMRFDFFAGKAAEGETFDVEYIAFFNTAEAAAEYDYEMHKAPMWNEDLTVVVHQSFDQLYSGNGDAVNGPENFFTPGASAEWDYTVTLNDFSVDTITYWGWVGYKGELGSFGYQINGGAAIYNPDWAFVGADHDGVVAAAKNGGADSGNRMKIAISLAGLEGENTIRVLYKAADGYVVCLNEFTVTLPVKPKDITDSFVADVNSNEVGTSIDASDLANFFTVELPLGGCAVEANGENKLYHQSSISDFYADVNGLYYYKANITASNANAWMFVRGYKVVNSDEVIEKFDPNAGIYKINNYYETDSAGMMGGAGIYARIDAGILHIMVKAYSADTVTRVSNKLYSIACEGTELVMADNGDVVTIMVSGKTYATIALSGSKVYEDINEVMPKNGFAASAVVTLADGTTETIENTLIADTCECQIGIVARAGSIKFSTMEVGGYSAIEIPEMEEIGGGEVTPDYPESPAFDGLFHSNVDFINGTGPNKGGPYQNLSASKLNGGTGVAPVRDAVADEITVSNTGTLVFAGWMGVAGGINHYAYSVNGGEWQAIDGGADGEPLPGHYAGLGMEGATKKGLLNNLTIDLSAYNGETITVALGAIPEAQQDAAIPFLVIKNLAVAYEAPAADPEGTVVVDLSQFADQPTYMENFPAAGIMVPLFNLGYGNYIAIGQMDLSKFSKVEITYSCDGSAGTEANFAAASSLAIGLKSTPSSYGQVTDDNFDGDIAHTDMVFSAAGWTGYRVAELDLSAVDYNGEVYVTMHNPAGTTIAISGVKFIP